MSRLQSIWHPINNPNIGILMTLIEKKGQMKAALVNPLNRLIKRLQLQKPGKLFLRNLVVRITEKNSLTASCQPHMVSTWKMYKCFGSKCCKGYMGYCEKMTAENKLLFRRIKHTSWSRH